MSRGPGRIERAIRELFDASPDLAFVTDELVEHCFPGVKPDLQLGQEPLFERKYQVSVLRAVHKIIADDPDWMAERIRERGRGWVFFNHASVQSYALHRLIAEHYEWNLSREEWLSRLAEQRNHDLIQPSGAWFRHVEMHIARRDGDATRAGALEREHEKAMVEIMAGFGKRFPTEQKFDNETLTMIGTVFGWLADTIREAARQNDPDEQRATLDITARNLDVLQQAVTGSNPPAAVRHILNQIDRPQFAGAAE